MTRIIVCEILYGTNDFGITIPVEIVGLMMPEILKMPEEFRRRMVRHENGESVKYFIDFDTDEEAIEFKLAHL